ncbi:hypothetical protein ABK040_014532 [Willaertia magna]
MEQLSNELLRLRLVSEYETNPSNSNSSSSGWINQCSKRLYHDSLIDCIGEYSTILDSSRNHQDYIQLSKDLYNNFNSNNNNTKPNHSYKLISKQDIIKNVPILQHVLLPRKHEYVAPKITFTPSTASITNNNSTDSFSNNSKPVNKTNVIVNNNTNNNRRFPNNRNAPQEVVDVDDMVDDTDEKKPFSNFTTAKAMLNKKKKLGGNNNNYNNSDDDEDTSPVNQRKLSDIKGSSSNYHPVTSITNNAAVSKKRKKFVPPLKSNDDNSTDNNNGSSSSNENTKKKKKEDKDSKNPDLSKIFDDGVIPEDLTHLDPKLIEMISNEILHKVVDVKWDDIAGLSYAKKSVQEAVIWPLMRPDLFTGLRQPPKGLLLFGPPGTGKTLIGKAIAHESKSTFFSISASSLTSKWVGEGEKLVKTLFALARHFQPSVVFIDEIDSLLSQRTESDADNGTRRMKTEFLVQLDGAATDSEQDRILLVGATNRPEELDEAFRRRMTKKLYIPLPSKEGRKEMITRLLSKSSHNLSEEDIEEVVTLTIGYSGSDIKNLCAESALFPIRDLGELIKHVSVDDVRPITLQDMKLALKSIRPSVNQGDLERYVKWNKDNGSFDFGQEAEMNN